VTCDAENPTDRVNPAGPGANDGPAGQDADSAGAGGRDGQPCATADSGEEADEYEPL
jgi:hypothetical protein